MPLTNDERRTVRVLLEARRATEGEQWWNETLAEPGQLATVAKALVTAARVRLDNMIASHAADAAARLAQTTAERDALIAIEAKLP